MNSTQSQGPVILIPAFEPDSNLLHLLQYLLDNSDLDFIIVDDGSTTDVAKSVFKTIANLPRVQLLSHETNLGKGAALKTGITHFLRESSPHSPGIISADADGQHLPK